MSIGYGEIVLRLLLATAIGIIFGIERQRNNKPVGARTHVLIALAACLIAIISAYGFTGANQQYASGININADPARLVTGILTGIGFIGAGIIFRTPTGVQGITTAAAVFLLATLSIAIGLGFYFLAGIATLIALLTMLTTNINRKNKQQKKQTDETQTEQQPENPEHDDLNP
jgi:putative Mg2+ transporter-C (MgtC) family protein